MPIKVRIPTPLAKLTGGKLEVRSEGRNVRELIDNLDRQYDGTKERLLDESGNVRRFVNIYVGGEDIRFSEGLDTSVNEDSEVSIVPAIAGG
ncbi:MAG: MoaD/ThiS family protein [Candidatus Altiarchaeales archaeon]|nr:MoaD/ThiS family protein [Candidatus Altiarchaeota archaeon]MBU4340963.1 MoaD/ThiS family protein [Candidatus Altiarchaeota archaeon]MBU4436726.1 MoaD/ThiS family protein [Candidatus Altiarchaeota archaeon]MCG2782216.1 MoaD/ThiS family protein [Candidatus Altiarchaeales archaeon]